jgi:hypothetical protein
MKSERLVGRERRRNDNVEKGRLPTIENVLDNRRKNGMGCRKVVWCRGLRVVVFKECGRTNVGGREDKNGKGRSSC